MTDFAHLNDYILLAHLKLQNLLMFTYVHFTSAHLDQSVGDYIHKTLVQIAHLKFVTHNKFKNTYDQFR